MGFKADFMWGATSAAYQVEGAWDADGKGPGIWDVLSRAPGRVAGDESGDVACDHYHRFREDVAMMKAMGLKHYRFSISWPRVLPQGVGEVNPQGLRFYSRLVDALLEAGIEPVVTLYHWNMPYALYQQGGWRSGESPRWFEEYVRLMADALGDRVKYWLTFNEPQMFMFLGHQAGVHAPFEHCSDGELIAMSRNVLLAHGLGVRALRERLGARAQIGFSPTGDVYVPEEETPQAIQAALDKSLALGEAFVFSNTWWCDPIFFGRFPEEAHRRFGAQVPVFSAQEWALVTQKLDFFAYNIYEAHGEFVDGALVNPQFEYPGCPMTMANWCVTPQCLYWSARFWYERYRLPVLIAENGVSLGDWVCLDGKVHDAQRIDFLTRYLSWLRRAADEGVDVMGYTHWSLLDNFEWAAGYRPRYGLIYVDFRTQTRTVKDSGWWYRDLIASNGADLPLWSECLAGL